MHVLPDLAALERKYAGQPVTVVGVHSAKFDNEKVMAPSIQAISPSWHGQYCHCVGSLFASAL